MFRAFTDFGVCQLDYRGAVMTPARLASNDSFRGVVGPRPCGRNRPLPVPSFPGRGLFIMPRLTFNSLLQTPSIAALKADAVSIAINAERNWFPHWIADSLSILLEAIDAAAEALGVAPEEIDVALTGLLDAYHVARRRWAKREANA